jgi:hypothetical protein
MNWEAIGAIGEIVGAIAVVVTIGYLAVQIRQNTLSNRATFLFQAQTEFTRMQEQIFGNPDNARLLGLLRNRELPADLSPIDLERIKAYSNGLMNAYVSLAVAHVNRQIDNELYENYCRDFERWVMNWYPGLIPISKDHLGHYPWAKRQRIFEPLFKP